jgi:hypothetical protein
VAGGGSTLEARAPSLSTHPFSLSNPATADRREKLLDCIS